MRFSIIFFGLLFYTGTLLSQQPDKWVDSLEQALFFTEDASKQLQLNNELAKAWLDGEPEKSLEFSKKAIELASMMRVDKQEAIAFYYRGVALSNLYNYPDAIEVLLTSKELFMELGEKAWTADVCYELGDAYKNNLDFEQALSELFKGLSIVQKMGDKNKIARILNQIGGVYYDQEDFDDAYKYFKQSMLIWEKLGNKRGMAIQFNNIGEMYRFKGEYERALSYYRKAISLNAEILNNENLSLNYDNMGNVFLSMGKYDSSVFYLMKSLEIGKMENDPHLKSIVNNSLGLLYLKKEQQGTAVAYYQKAFEFARQAHLNDQLKDAAYGLSLIYAKERDFKKALFYHKKFKALNDSIMNADNSSKITAIELKLKFENEKKIKEFDQQRTRFVSVFTALGLFGLIIVLVMLYGRLKINIRHSKSKAINLYIENKRLQEDIDFKNKELATNVMYLLKKNELINYISEKLLKAKVRFKSQNQSIIEEILLDLQSNINSEIWQEFEIRFQAVHKGFYDKLNIDFPRLTDADKKLCALLRLNLSTKEIASISHQNPNSVEVARTRLRKKLDLSNQDISLVSFLSNL